MYYKFTVFLLPNYQQVSHTNLIKYLGRWKFVAENYTEKFDALKFTLKNNIKDDSTENHTEIIPLLFRNA